MIDLFREWDEDGDGTVSKKEFRVAMPLLGLKGIPIKAIDALFDEWDPDHSGQLNLKELTKVLRRRGEIEMSGELLEAGGGGEIATNADNKLALRTAACPMCPQAAAIRMWLGPSACSGPHSWPERGAPRHLYAKRRAASALARSRRSPR